MVDEEDGWGGRLHSLEKSENSGVVSKGHCRVRIKQGHCIKCFGILNRYLVRNYFFWGRKILCSAKEKI